MTCVAPSFFAIIGMSMGWLLNENDDVRGTTRNDGFCASRWISSSDRPSARYCWSRSGLKSTNGSTATLATFIGAMPTCLADGPNARMSMAYQAVMTPAAIAKAATT